jgi:hypothetical protein
LDHPTICKKKVVPTFLSKRSIVIAPARTGRDKINKNEVIRIAHTNKLSLEYSNPGALILNIVTMKFKDPKIEDTPVR